MPRILCHYVDCVFLDDRFCSAASIELDPDTGCMTYRRTADVLDEDDWEDEIDDEWVDEGFEEEDDDDFWLDEDDEDDDEFDDDF